MKFEKLTDLVQVFANEYCLPGNIVLVLGHYDPKIKTIFEFINSDVIFVNNCDDSNFDIICDFSDLCFENFSFDLIINFTDQQFFKFLKPDGYILMKGEILNASNYYSLQDEIFTVI